MMTINQDDVCSDLLLRFFWKFFKVAMLWKWVLNGIKKTSTNAKLTGREFFGEHLFFSSSFFKYYYLPIVRIFDMILSLLTLFIYWICVCNIVIYLCIREREIERVRERERFTEVKKLGLKLFIFYLQFFLSFMFRTSE